jgi:hypothetical protein
MYAPLGINWKTAQRLDERDCSLSWPGDTPSTYNHVDIVWFDALRVLLAMELVAAASVYIPWAIFVIRDRRRRRATRCLMCGHQLGPSPRPARCPECGSSVQTGQPRKPTSLRQRLGARPGRVCLMVWLILILSWIVASIALGGRLPLPNLVDRLAEEAADTRHRPADQTSYYSAGVDIREYGWPCMVVSRWIIQSFKFEPGQEPVAVPRTRIEPGFYIGDHRDVQWIWRRDDPTTSGTLAIQWAMGLLQLYGLHLAAVAMTWGIMAVTALCAMTRSARPQAA